MDCTKAKNLIPDLIDGALDKMSAAAVQAHCGRCPSCAEERDLLDVVALSVAGLPDREAGPRLNAAVMAALAPDMERAAAAARVSDWALWGGTALAGSFTGWAIIVALGSVFFGSELAALLPSLQLELLKGVLVAQDVVSVSSRLLSVLAFGINVKALLVPMGVSAILASGILAGVLQPSMRFSRR